MRILAVGCHPDDLEIACYGTLAKYVKLGHEVSVCHIASGNMGHVEIDADEFLGIRLMSGGGGQNHRRTALFHWYPGYPCHR